MEGNFSDEPEAAVYRASDFYGGAIVPLSKDDPMLWGNEEMTTAEVCGRLFAGEYLYDFDASKAMLRLGVASDQADAYGRDYLKHWYVQRIIRECLATFRQHKIATEDSVTALLWRDASNYGRFSNPVARVGAQKVLAKVLGMEPEDRRKALEDERGSGNSHGGVMVTFSIENELDWDSVSEESQRQLKEEVLR